MNLLLECTALTDCNFSKSNDPLTPSTLDHDYYLYSVKFDRNQSDEHELIHLLTDQQKEIILEMMDGHKHNEIEIDLPIEILKGKIYLNNFDVTDSIGEHTMIELE